MGAVVALGGRPRYAQRMGETRRCHRCRQDLPLHRDFFFSDKSRPHGLSYECRACHSARKKGRDRRPERWSRLTPEQRARRMATTRRYAKTPKGRALFLKKAYEAIDKRKGHDNDIDQVFLLTVVFPGSCCYCGTREQLGCDRVDNSRGHTRDNVVVACADCNIMRGDRFSHDEMLVIGHAIAQVRAARDSCATAAANADRPSTASRRPTRSARRARSPRPSRSGRGGSSRASAS